MKPLFSPSALQSFQVAAFICLLGTAILMHPGYPQMINHGDPPVVLPSASAPAVLDEHPTDILLKIDATGCRFVNHRWAPDPEFRLAIRRARAVAPSGRFVLQADARLPFGAVRSLLADLRAENIQRVSLVTEPLPEPVRQARPWP